MTKNHIFGRSSAIISYKIHLFFGENILVSLKTYAKKRTHPRSFFWGGGGRGERKSCWLIAYYVIKMCNHSLYYEHSLVKTVLCILVLILVHTHEGSIWNKVLPQNYKNNHFNRPGFELGTFQFVDTIANHGTIDRYGLVQWK